MCGRCQSISIHALREEGDSLPSTTYSSFWNFYPRPPRGGRPCNIDVTKPVTLFLSTPSARRATSWCGSLRRSRTDFYPRPPQGGRPFARACKMLWRPISIHALRKEGDRDACSYCRSLVEFLSTPSARRATWNTWKIAFPIWNFYPRPPRGGRLSGRCRNSHGREHFYPRPPQGGRPGDKRFNGAYNNFYPRPPQGGRRGLFRLGLRVVKFLSTPSARRATLTSRVGGIIF